MGLESVVQKAKDIYLNNRMVNLNVNTLIAAAPSIMAATGCSEYMSAQGCSEGSITLGAAITDWVTYLPVHIGLHYKTNKKQFQTEEGFDKKAFVKDVAHVYATYAPALALFYAMVTPLHYYLMDTGMGSASSTQVAYWGTMIVSRAVHTATGCATGLFRNNNGNKNKD